jgi:hypothetical protein
MAVQRPSLSLSICRAVDGSPARSRTALAMNPYPVRRIDRSISVS